MRRSLSVVGLAVLVVLLAGCNLLDWPQYGANGANAGTAGLSPLNTHTVGSLQQAWVVPSPNVSPATLAVAGGTVYASSPPNEVISSIGGFSAPPPSLEAHSVTDGSLRWSAGSATFSGTPPVDFCVSITFGTDPVVSSGQYDYQTLSGECFNFGNGTFSCNDTSIDATSGVAGTPTSNPDGCITSDPVAAKDGTVYVARTPLAQNPGPNGPGPAVVGSDGSVFIAPGTNAGSAQLSTPAVDGNSLFVVTNTGQLVAFDRTTNQMLWSQSLGQLSTDGLPPPTPSVVNGRVFVVNSAVPNTQAFDATTGQPLWSAALPDAPSPSAAPAATDSAVFVRTGTALLALDADSGATLWQASIGASSTQFPTLGSPSVVNDVVFVGTQDGRLLAFDATGKGCSTANGCAPIWSATLSGGTQSIRQIAAGSTLGSRPVISGDAVYISAANSTAGGSNLYKFSLSGH